MCLPCQQAAKKIKDITNGYTNLIFKDSDVEELACKRLEICGNCESKTPLLKVAGKQYYNCSECHCPLDAATRSTGYSCPKNKW